MRNGISLGILLLISFGFASSEQASADTPKIPLESLFQMITPKWSNEDLKSGRSLDEFLMLSLNGDENAIAYYLPSAPQHIMKSYQGGPGAYYFGVPIILDVEKDGDRYAQCALIYKHYYLERRDQRLFATIGCDHGASTAHPVPTTFLKDLEDKGVENCGPGCRYHFVRSQSPDKQALIQEIKGLYLDETYNFDMLTLPKEAARYKISYSVFGGKEFQSIEFDVVEEQIKGVASNYTIYRLQGPWQNHAALRYGADKNLYFQYYDQAPLGVMEVLERDGQLKRDIDLYVIANGKIIAHQDASENLRRDQTMNEDTKPEYKRIKPALRYDGPDGRGNIFIGGKDHFHHLLETHKGDLTVVWSEKTDAIEFSRAWTFEFPGKTIVPADEAYKISKRLNLKAGNSMSQDRNSDRYFWSVASETGAKADSIVANASWIQDPQRLEQEATAVRMQADRDRRDQERIDRKAQILAENAIRDAQYEQHLQEVAEREQAVELEVAAAQAAAMAEAESELQRAQQILEEAQSGAPRTSSSFIGSLIAYLTTCLLIVAGTLYSREILGAKLPPIKRLLDNAHEKLANTLPVVGIILIACGALGVIINALSFALFANVVPQIAAVALGINLSANKIPHLTDDSSGASDVTSNEPRAKSAGGVASIALNLIEQNKASIGLAATATGLVNLILGGAFYII